MQDHSIDYLSSRGAAIVLVSLAAYLGSGLRGAEPVPPVLDGSSSIALAAVTWPAVQTSTFYVRYERDLGAAPGRLGSTRNTDLGGEPPSAERPVDLDRIVDDAAWEFDVSADLIHALMKYESSHRTNVRSKTGCRGLMQVGGHWRNYRRVIERHGLVDDPDDARTNIFVGAWILRDMKRSIRRRHLRSRADHIRAIIASYNIGPVVVRKAVRAAAAELGRRPTWAETYRRITPALLQQTAGYRRGRWNDGERGAFSRVAKTRKLKYFVRRVFRLYRRRST